jgi:alkylation response protein AidB-like acyl-CoA dehydrogenase
VTDGPQEILSDIESEAIIQKCRDLADKFRPRSAKYDREGSFPVENFEDIKEAGLLGLMVPKDKGGMGADFVTYTRALEQLAMGDGSTALTFNMHNITAGNLAGIDLSKVTGKRAETMNRFRDWAFAEMIEKKKVFASANSEPGVGAHFTKLKSRYSKVDGGYVINGLKSFVSMAGYADYYIAAAKKEGPEGDFPDLTYFAIERENPGIKIDKIWDTLGMRATCSDMMHLNDVFVPSERLFMGTQGMGLLMLVREPHWVIAGYVGVYLGLCSAIFNFMVDYLRNKKIPGSEDSVITREWVQHQVGGLSVRMEAARTVVYDAARQVNENPGTIETNTAVHRSKYMVSELGPDLASQAIRLCGGGSIARRFPLEQLYRDARCGGLMPATSDDCLMYVGKSALGIDMTKISENNW